MSEQDLIEENKKLKERIAYLENIIDRGNEGNSSAYNAIRGLIINKVATEYNLAQFENLDNWQKKHKQQVAERNLMSDLKWALKVRRISDFRMQHIEQAKEYLAQYEIPEQYRKEVQA